MYSFLHRLPCATTCNTRTTDRDFTGNSCAAEAFQETLNYQSEPLTLGKANKIASECRKRNEMAEVKRVRENERNKIREKQIQALNDAHSVKER